jgi:putative spermidine/putrescine transport system ATP-binding protein
MTHLALCALSKHYTGQLAVDDVTLDVAPGEMVVLLGPSGCGKTTTLRMIGGFVPASGGDILLDDTSIRDWPAHRREMGIVFQSYALFPHLTVARNVAFGLEMRRRPNGEIAARVAEMLDLVKLGQLADRLPRQLSGGQQQRVALARALAIRPRVLLLDEPLSNLDAALRQEVARDIRILQRDGNLTSIMVTHDQEEAMAMADRLVVMKDGRVQQIGTQEDLYERPANPFVARFIGHSNMLRGRIAEGAALLLPGGQRTALAARYARTGEATLALRPERLATCAPDAPEARISGTIELSTYLGATLEHVVAIAPDTRLVIRDASISDAPRRTHRAGETVGITWPRIAERLFDSGDLPVPQDDLAPADRITHHA